MAFEYLFRKVTEVALERSVESTCLYIQIISYMLYTCVYKDVVCIFFIYKSNEIASFRVGILYLPRPSSSLQIRMQTCQGKRIYILFFLFFFANSFFLWSDHSPLHTKDTENFTFSHVKTFCCYDIRGQVRGNFWSTVSSRMWGRAQDFWRKLGAPCSYQLIIIDMKTSSETDEYCIYYQVM